MGSHGAAFMVYPILFFQFSFLTISLFLGVTAEFFLVEKFNRLFLGELIGVPLDMTP